MKNKLHVMISNRHMHLNREALDILFGEGYELTGKRPMAPPIFAANETVTLQGPKGRIEGVRILGPLRNYNQVEILRADNFVPGSRAGCCNPVFREKADTFYRKGAAESVAHLRKKRRCRLMQTPTR